MNKLKKAMSAAWCEFGLLALMSAVRFLYYGFKYFPQLDDCIQYHNYEAGYTVAQYWQTVKRVGLLGARPLAGLSDLYIWSAFWGCMIIAVLIISTLLAASAMIFKKVFSRYFRCGRAFLLIYALLPLGIEGVYWMSASTRLVCGLFFASVSALCYCVWCDRGAKRYALLCILAQTAAFCYYEQVLVLSFSLNLLIMLCELKRSFNARPWLALSGIGSAAFYFVITRLFSQSSVFASRTELALPVSRWYFDHFLPDIAGQIGSVFAKGGFYTLVKGAWRGIGIMLSDGSAAFIIIIIALCALLALNSASRRAALREGAREKENADNSGRFPLPLQLLFALLLAAAPVSIFFVIANPWFSLRNALPSLPGIALAADGVLIWMAERLRKRRAAEVAYAAVIFIAGFVCISASVSELHDYRLTFEKDNEVASLLISEYGKEELEKPTVIFNLEPTYLDNQNFYWHEHIHGATESAWALRGLINSKMEPGYNSRVTPMALRSVLYKAWNYDNMQLEGFKLLLYYHPESSTLEQVELIRLEEGYYSIASSSGETLFYVREEDKTAYYEPAESN